VYLLRMLLFLDLLFFITWLPSFLVSSLALVLSSTAPWLLASSSPSPCLSRPVECSASCLVFPLLSMLVREHYDIVLRLEGLMDFHGILRLLR